MRQSYSRYPARARTLNDSDDEEDLEFEIRERRFVAIATAEYDKDSSFSQLPEVRQEVEEIRGWLLDDQLGLRRFKEEREELANNPPKSAIAAAFLDPDTRVNWPRNDAAVIYITGHGVNSPRGTGHYLVLTNTKQNGLASEGLATAELFTWLAECTDVDHLFVIVDACFAGSVTETIVGFARDHWLILPSAASGQRARPRALTDAIHKFIKRAGRFNVDDPYFRVGMFVRELNHFLPPGQTVEKIYKGENHEEHFCLPNPAYQPDLRAETFAVRRALALPKRALELHNQAGGWLFSGREELQHRLINATKAPGVTMVAGSAGCGKSAALSRLVTLSDPKFRRQYEAELLNVPEHMMPDLGTVQLAVSARQKSNEDLLEQMCHLLKAKIERRKAVSNVQACLDALIEHIDRVAEERETTRPVTIVIDALDEATEQSSLVRSVLAPLWQAHPEKLCLLLGVRSLDSGGALGSATAGRTPDRDQLADLVEAELGAQRISVDQAPCWEPDDVDAFVSNILTNTPGSPYRDADGAVAVDAVAGVSAAIRKVSGSSYLMAQVAAESLAKRTAIMAADDQAWRATLSKGLIGVLREDLKVSIPEIEERRPVVMLLRAVAFARGNGLPWHLVWALMANAADADGVSTYGDSEVELLLGGRFNAYLETDQQDDLTVYRLIHDELREALRSRWRELLEEPTPAGEQDPPPPPPESAAEIETVEERITSNLSTLVRPKPSDAVDQPPPTYVRRHLAEHALAGGELDRLPLSVLPYLDLAGLRAAIGVAPERRHLEENVPWLPVIRRVTHLWDWDDPSGNAAAIEMWQGLTGTGLSGKVGGSWRVRWAIGPPDNGSILGRHDQQVWAAATADLSGTPVAVTGDSGGALHIWDLRKGMSYREPIQTGGGALRSVATTDLPDGRSVAVTGSADGTVRIWELRTGHPVDGPIPAGRGEIKAVATATLPDGQVVVAAADDTGTIRTWNLVTRRPVGRPVITGPTLALGLATARVGGRTLGLATGQDGGLQLWDLATGDSAVRLAKPENVRSTTHTDADGRPIAAAMRNNREVAITSYGNMLLIWDLRDREVTDRLPGSDGTVRSLAVIERDDQVVAVTGGNTAGTAWDLSAGRPLGEPLTGHDGSVEAVALIESADGTLAVSAGRDKTARVWELTADRRTGPQPSTEQLKTVNAVATATLRGRAVAITGSRNVVQVRDLERGTSAAPPLTGHTSAVVSVTAAELPDDDDVLIVAGGWDGSIRAWSASGGQLVGSTAHLHRGGIESLATARLADGRVVVVTGGRDGRVRVWDPFAGAEPCEPLQDRTLAVVTFVAVCTADGATLVVSGSSDGHIQVRDLDAHANPDIEPSWPSVDIDTGVKIASLTITRHPDGPLSIVVGVEDGTVRVLAMQDGTALGPHWRAHSGAVAAVSAAPLADGRVAVFTGGTESLVQAWDISTGRAIAEALPTPGPVRAMTCHPSPPRLLIGGAGAAVAHLQHSR